MADQIRISCRRALWGAALTMALATSLTAQEASQSAMVAHSRDSGRTAWAVVWEGGAVLTEVWVAGRGEAPRRLRTFPGRPEGMAWDGDRLCYADRGLTLPLVVGSPVGNGLEIVLASGRRWLIPMDGGEEGKKRTGEQESGRVGEESLSLSPILPFSLSGVGGGTVEALPEVLRGEAGPEVRRALAAVGEGFSLVMMAHSAAMGGDFKGASAYYRQAAERFEGMPSVVREADLSRGVCQSYALDLRVKAKASRLEMGRAICEDHLKAVGGFLKGYLAAHDGHFPPDLAALKAWVEGQYVRPGVTGQGAVSQIFRSPVDVNAGISYGYRLPDPANRDSGPVVWSYFYPGRAVELIRSGDDFRVIGRPLGQAQVDSLLGVGLRSVEVDSPAVAVAALEALARVAPMWAKGHCKLGYACLKAGDLDRAQVAFQRAISLDQRLSEAYCGLGLVFMRRPRGLYAAIDRFQEALKWNPRYVEARYHIAVARLKMEEYDARQEAEKVIALDPKFAPVYRLMGEWYEEMQEDYENAALWYTRYLSLNPDDPEARLRLGRSYLKARDFEKITGLLMDYVQKHPEEIHGLPILAQACLEMKRLDWALTFFKRYLDRIDPAERAFYEDIRLVAYPEEMAEYGAAVNGQREAFLKRFWGQRDPNLLTEVNERHLEHYRRVWYARQNFAARKQPLDRRGEVYIRFGEPDHRSRSNMANFRQSLEVQRIKEKMAREIYGEEAANMTYFGPVFPVRSLRLTLSDAPKINGDIPQRMQQDLNQTSALNQRRETRRGDIQDDQNRRTSGPSALSGVGETGEFEGVAQMDNLQEQEDVMDRVRTRAPTMEERVFGSGRDGQFRPNFMAVTAQEDASMVGWESWVYTRVGGGIEITFTDENGNGNFDYAPPPLDANVPIHRMSKFNFYAPQKVVERTATASVDAYIPRIDTSPLRFYYDVADFRGIQGGRSAVEVYYGMPHSTGCYFPEQDSTRMVVDRQVALLDLSTGVTYRTQGDLVFLAAGDLTRQRGGVIPDVARLEVPPGKYRLEVSARDRLTGRMGVYRQDVEVGNYERGRVRLSGLELAWQVSEGQEGDKFTKRGMRVIPLPTRTFRKGQGIFVYYEVYNLKQDASGQTSHTMEYTVRSEAGGIFSRIARTFVGKKPEVAVSQGQAGTEEAEYRYLELDLKGLTPGKGVLAVTVKDLISGEAVRRELAFMMAE
ncbi:MAG: GWxTD domain-containing protein [Candidatus Latescibacteria bacterium]|nr:GWxTD domain-containing protein [Candidatus Latescibacterota bacterium]